MLFYIIPHPRRKNNPQKGAADVNGDGSTDASSILGYYAYIATGGKGTIEEYLS